MKKNTVLTIIVTALATCLVTNTIKDINHSKAHGGLYKKIASISDILANYSIYDIDTKEMSDLAAKAITSSIDDIYTNYYTAEEFNQLNTQLSNGYRGIGITLGADLDSGKLKIVSVTPGGPAEKSGLLPDDYILSADGKNYSAEQMDEAVYIIKGMHLSTTTPPPVKLTIERAGSTFDVEVSREVINNPTVYSTTHNQKIGYIRITQFNHKNPDFPDSKDTYTEFLEHLNSFSGIESLIIDLRDNPGGDLAIVTKIADHLLPEGTITYTEDKNGKKVYYDSDEKDVNLPMVVLINENSASASEVLCGALKDYKKAAIVGEKTYGKGVVQTVIPLYDGSGLTITSAKYYTPSGECIHEKGINPDVLVELDIQKTVSNLEFEEDLQLQKAIEILN